MVRESKPERTNTTEVHTFLYPKTNKILTNMKHNYFLLLLVALCLTSCSQLYNYVQVFETKSLSEKIKKADKGLLYEDDHCSIYYSFWANGGDASFSIFNKTDEIMYIDLGKSFFIRNNIANDYYKEREWAEARTISTSVQTSTSAAASGSKSRTYGASAAYIGNYGTLPITERDPILTTASANITEAYGIVYTTAVANSVATSRTISSAFKEQKILAIPPMSSKIVIEYSISESLLLNCDLDRYPEEKASIEFDETNSPLFFTNYVTYKLGESSKEQVIKNTFYVSKITNYAEPSAYTYLERDKPCQNLTSDDTKDYNPNYPVTVYDRYYKFDISNCFYLKYDILSNRRLYKDNRKYYYSPTYDGYTAFGSDPQSDYQQKLVDPFAKPEK